MMKLLKGGLLFVLMLASAEALSHPMPYSVLLFDVKTDGVVAEVQVPLKELQLALPQLDIEEGSGTLLSRMRLWLNEYLQQHLRVEDAVKGGWTIRFDSVSVAQGSQDGTGTYKELRYYLYLQPPAGGSVRRFNVYYDAVMHQVVTHRAYVVVRQDWAAGHAGDGQQLELGVISVDTRDNRVHPFLVRLEDGSMWSGVRSMAALGMDHIAEGTDHLLFLLVLLLPAPLLASGGRWGVAGGTHYSVVRLLKIITAFTIGHSLTLIAGAVGWLRLPSGPVEVIIAFSILVGAVHAVRPLFAGREAWVAGGFGLVHGLAFAATLSGLQLDAASMTLSIFGFNIGIEIMQLFIILMTVPWLFVLSKYPPYRWVRITGALFAALAAGGWMVERITGKSNSFGQAANLAGKQGNILVLGLAILAVGCIVAYRKRKTLTDAVVK